MNNKLVQAIVIVMILGIAGFIGYDMLQSRESNQASVTKPTTTPGECVPTFVDGGGPYYKANSPFRTKIVPEENNGERLIVKGKIVLSDCKTPVPAAVLDIWQANETGNYQDEWYRGQVTADNNGEYMFETVIPKGYGEGTAFRPPHIHFKVFRDSAEVITSQMFFPEIEGTAGFDKAYIMKLTETSTPQGKLFEGYHDIVLP